MTTLNQTHPTLIGTLWPARANAAARWILLVIGGSLFVAASAQIQVPMWPVPMTMQTFAVLLVGAAYGSRLGAATMLAYLAEGAAGLPVFAGFSGGIGVLQGPTVGYIVGFIFAAGVVGWLAERTWDRNVLTTAVAMLAGNVLIYVPGLIVLAGFVGADKVVAYGLAPFLLGDAIKLALAAALLPAAWKIVGKAH
jgi:biotin transport system substrate-specific component